jgi:excisionase family DNA binding protein
MNKLDAEFVFGEARKCGVMAEDGNREYELNLDRMYTVDEVAQRLGVSRATVLRWLRSEQMKGLKAGRSWRVSDKDLQAYLRRSWNQREGEAHEDDQTIDGEHTDTVWCHVEPGHWKRTDDA